MYEVIDVKAKENFKIWVKYSDGVEGEINLQNFVGKGVFIAWKDYNFFKKVHIGTSGEIAWDNDIDLCPDAIYMELTGKTAQELFPKLREEIIYA
jgi:hypothetical protein